MVTPKDADEQAKLLVTTWMKRYRRGSLRFFILHLLRCHSILDEANQSLDPDIERKKSIHGYKIAQEIDEVTKGKWHPKTSSIYPILKELTEKRVLEMISGEVEDPRSVKHYRLTPFGMKVAEKLEESRKEFTRSFILGKEKPIGPPPQLFSNLSQEELQEVLTETEAERLELHLKHLHKSMEHTSKLIQMVEDEISTRMKNKNKESDKISPK
ncbi:PadR family transcriptional regulator [Candidatus Hodarchaeum mangrovi]